MRTTGMILATVLGALLGFVVSISAKDRLNRDRAKYPDDLFI